MTKLVGILNLTPDSFSGDGVAALPQSAEERMDAMIADGADVIDIGAESTRPGAVLLSPAEEWKRFEPVMEAVAARTSTVSFSIDTRHPETARKFLKCFKNTESVFLNDVSGGKDSGMFNLAKEYNTKLVLMHSLTAPADPKITLANDVNAIEVIYEWAAKLVEEHEGNIIIDPGIGFGKTPVQSLMIIKNIARLKSLGAPLMVGHSRKSFMSLFTSKKADERDPETVLISDYLVEQGVDYLRVHDIKSHASLLRIRKML